MTDPIPAPLAPQPDDRAPNLVWCSYCQGWHAPDAFYHNAWRGSQRDHICKACRARASRAYYRGNRASVRAQQAAYQAARLREVS